jgi:hypothetical protein
MLSVQDISFLSSHVLSLNNLIHTHSLNDPLKANDTQFRPLAQISELQAADRAFFRIYPFWIFCGHFKLHVPKNVTGQNHESLLTLLPSHLALQVCSFSEPSVKSMYLSPTP